MSLTLTVKDETLGAKAEAAFTLELMSATITAEELIRQRVYQEVQDYNRNQRDVFTGLVEPTDAEKTLNGYRLRKPRQIDWEKQFQKAREAFKANGFFLLVDAEQVTDLADELELSVDTEVRFVRLTPLVGG